MRFDPSIAGLCEGRTEAADEARNKRGDPFIAEQTLTSDNETIVCNKTNFYAFIVPYIWMSIR